MIRIIRRIGIGLLALAALAPAARAGEKAEAVEGAWRQVAQKNGAAQEYRTLPDGTEMTDYVVGGRFVWTVVREGKVLGIAGGRYKVEKDTFTEIMEYASGPDLAEMFVGKTFEFTVKVDGDTLTKVGTIRLNGQDFKVVGKWERCKP